MKSMIKMPESAAEGIKKIEWARANMPLLNEIRKDFKANRPFEGLNIALSIHLEAKTANLTLLLKDGGANMYVTGSNPLSTQDDVAAGLASLGVNVYAEYGVSNEDYVKHLNMVLDGKPNIIIDDGGDLVNLLHGPRKDLINGVIGGCEETTTGIRRLKALDSAKELKIPVIAVNNAKCKYLFDNRYGTGQSVWNGINRTTNLIVAGKTCVVAGYGWCGKGVAMRAAALGGKVIVCEIDDIKALEAYMDGFDVMTMDEAAKYGDIFVTVTGCKDVITEKHFKNMKDGAILSNAGHFNVEINVDQLSKAAIEITERRNNITGYKMPDGRWINLLAEGRLVNLAAGDGHPAEIMDMSFAIQALSAKFIAENRENIKNGKEGKMLMDVPPQIDSYVAGLKLKTLGKSIDKLTKEQTEYINAALGEV